MSSAVSAISSSPVATTAKDPNSSSTASTLDPLANEQTFLKLLVSQLQNQDPLNPTDSNQFVSQLTSYSQLEQLIGIRQNTSSTSASTGTDPSGTTPTAPTTTPSSSISSTVSSAANKIFNALGV